MCKRKREIVKEREMALIHCVSSCFDAVKEHACQAAKMDDMLSGGFVVANKRIFVYLFFSLLFYSASFFQSNVPVHCHPRRL